MVIETPVWQDLFLRNIRANREYFVDPTTFITREDMRGANEDAQYVYGVFVARARYPLLPLNLMAGNPLFNIGWIATMINSATWRHRRAHWRRMFMLALSQPFVRGSTGHAVRLDLTGKLPELVPSTPDYEVPYHRGTFYRRLVVSSMGDRKRYRHHFVSIRTQANRAYSDTLYSGLWQNAPELALQEGYYITMNRSTFGAILRGNRMRPFLFGYELVLPPALRGVLRKEEGARDTVATWLDAGIVDVSDATKWPVKQPI